MGTRSVLLALWWVTLNSRRFGRIDHVCDRQFLIAEGMAEIWNRTHEPNYNTSCHKSIQKASHMEMFTRIFRFKARTKWPTYCKRQFWRLYSWNDNFMLWLLPEIARWQCFHPVCLCVCVCLSVYVCHDEELVPNTPYFAAILLGMSSCASYVSRTHDVIDDVTRSQNRSNFEIDISPSIFELERRSKAQNIGNANGYLSGTFNFR